jgi:ketosteroid isomerase-like protein
MGTLKFSNLEFNILSKKAAWVFGSWELKRENDNPKGVFTLVMRKFEDGWKVVHDHTSTSVKSEK